MDAADRTRGLAGTSRRAASTATANVGAHRTPSTHLDDREERSIQALFWETIITRLDHISSLGNTGLSSVNIAIERYIVLKVTKTVALRVKSSDTIDDVKAKFGEMEGVAANFTELFFGGNHLENGKTLADYDIQKWTTLHMFIHSGVDLQIHIKAAQIGKIITLDVKNLDTIQDIKLLIQDKERIPVDQQALMYAGKRLEDSQTLAAYSIQNGATLHVVFCRGDEIQITVNMPFGDTIKFEAKIWYTVENVKTMIENMVGIPTFQQILTHIGKQLEDHKTLADYSLRKECYIDMALSMQILVRTQRGSTITLQVEDSLTINEVMAKIQEKELIPPKLQSLVFSGRSLDADRHLADYNVIHGSTLHLYTPMRTKMLDQIFVCTPKGEAIAVDMTQVDTIADVKAKIRDRIQLPAFLQKLTHEGKVLEDHKKLEHYRIKVGSKLHLNAPKLSKT